jgi:tetratricopeptide (TPR) repeat protein
VKTARPCLSDQELAAAVEGRATPGETAHLAECKRCTRSLALIRRLIRASGDSPDAADDALSRVEGRGRHSAANIEGGAPPHRWQFAAERDGASPAVALAMLDRFEALMDVASPDAVLMADAAINVAQLTAALVDDAGASLRCRAWKARAVALASFACYDEALEALEQAERAAEDLADVSTIAYAKAWLFANPDVWRPAEAIEIIEKHLPVFEQVSAERYRAALLLRIVIMMRGGDIARAEEALSLMTESVMTPVERAMVSANRAYCRLEAGDALGSLRLGREAATIYRTSGPAATLLLLQTEWTIARALGTSGDAETGLVIARRVSDEFARLSLEEHAVRAELTCIRLTLACDASADVERECDRVLLLCARWPGPRAACAAEALKYLREMAVRRAATLDDAITVENYVDSLRTARPLRFRPPMPLTTM